MKIKLYKNGAFVTFERLTPSGMYAVLLRSFCAIAKGMK